MFYNNLSLENKAQIRQYVKDYTRSVILEENSINTKQVVEDIRSELSNNGIKCNIGLITKNVNETANIALYGNF